MLINIFWQYSSLSILLLDADTSVSIDKYYCTRKIKTNTMTLKSIILRCYNTVYTSSLQCCLVSAKYDTGVAFLTCDHWWGFPLHLQPPLTQLPRNMWSCCWSISVILLCHISTCWHRPADPDSKQMCLSGDAIGNVKLQQQNTYVMNCVWKNILTGTVSIVQSIFLIIAF